MDKYNEISKEAESLRICYGMLSFNCPEVEEGLIAKYGELETEKFYTEWYKRLELRLSK